nr:serine/threonine-protein kinase [Ancylothrix sp. D3o]
MLKERYRALRLLGEGGFGKTFEISDTNKTTKVLKVLTENNTKAIALFEREAKVLERLKHPGIPRVEPDGYFTFLPRNSNVILHCLVMEKIEGSNLEEWFINTGSSQPLSQKQAQAWLKQLVEILDKVHHEQYFHRDIKPSNIMLRPTGQLALIDFGSVREVTGTYLAKVGGGGHKVTGIVSPGYTPPEQANGKAVPQSDFFALGRTMVFLLTGHDPNDFSENPRTGQLIWREKAPQISPSFADLIDYLIAPFPGNRPQNTGVILQRLHEIDTPEYSQNNTPANLPTAPPRAVNTPLASLPRSKRKRRSQKHNSQSRKSWIPKRSKLMGVITLLLFAGGVTALFTAAGSEFSDSFLRERNSPIVLNELPLPNNPVTLSGNSWKKPTLANTLAGHLWGVNALAISPDGKLLISGSVDKNVNVWNLAQGTVIYSLKGHTNEVWAIAISPDGKTAASGSGDSTIKLWDLATGTLKKQFSSQSGWVVALAFSPDGKTLVSGGADSTIKVWDLANDQLRATLRGHSEGVVALAFRNVMGSETRQPGSSLLVSAGGDNKLMLWDVLSSCDAGQVCSPLKILESQSRRVQTVAFSPDGNMLASGSGDGSINLWNLNSGKVEQTFFGHSDVVNSLAFSPDGKILASGAGSLDSTVKLWDVEGGQLLDTLKGHVDTIHAVAITPDGKTLISASEDTTIKIWLLR